MKRNIDYKRKSKVISNGLVEIQRKISLCKWKISQAEQLEYYTGEITNLDWLPYKKEQCKLLEQGYAKLNPDDWKEAYRVNDASYHRTKRLKDRIQKMINKGNCLFLTLTFTNDVLDSTNQETRKKYIKRFLKSNSNYYVANIDYGTKNEREHYHAVIVCDKVNHKDWPYGNLDFKRVRTNQDDSNVKMAKYITKLTNHAIKETCKQNFVIYSRDPKENL